jgi:RimJ/RimL family protein N-acetyltransferase
MDRSPPVSVPRLKTPRLTLREYRMEDFETFAENLQDPAATKFIGGSDRRTAWRIFGCQVGLWTLQGAGWWAIELNETGKPVGTVGAFFREGWPEIELGWTVYRSHWGRGIATEAAAEAVRHSFEVRGEKRVTALIDAGNAASLKVAERLGLVREAEVELYGTPVGRYARAADAR